MVLLSIETNKEKKMKPVSATKYRGLIIKVYLEKRISKVYLEKRISSTETYDAFTWKIFEEGDLIAESCDITEFLPGRDLWPAPILEAAANARWVIDNDIMA
jgi:hypothetical protein